MQPSPQLQQGSQGTWKRADPVYDTSDPDTNPKGKKPDPDDIYNNLFVSSMFI